MTKRFILTTTEFNGTLSFYDAEHDCETRMGTEYTLNKAEITLNQLNKENKELKELLQDKNRRYKEMETRLIKAQKENADIKHAIDSAMENERTHIGHNVLKQLKDSIWEVY